MRSWIGMLMILGLSVSLSGCASSYLADRGRDAADIFTATAGVGLGTKARVGPIQAGLLAQGDLAGLRGGTFPNTCGGYYLPILDIYLVGYGMDNFSLKENRENERRKKYMADTVAPFIQKPKTPEGSTGMERSPSSSYYTELEVVVAVGGSLRLGFNPGELVDFLLGWVGIDIYHDDLGKMNPTKDSGTNAVPSVR